MFLCQTLADFPRAYMAEHAAFANSSLLAHARKGGPDRNVSVSISIGQDIRATSRTKLHRLYSLLQECFKLASPLIMMCHCLLLDRGPTVYCCHSLHYIVPVSILSQERFNRAVGTD